MGWGCICLGQQEASGSQRYVPARSGPRKAPGLGRWLGCRLGEQPSTGRLPGVGGKPEAGGGCVTRGKGKGGCPEPQGSRWGPGVGKCVLMFTCPSKWGRIVAGGQRQGRPAPSTGLCLQPQLRSGGSKDPWFSAVCRTCEAVEE